jgi:hypothetical protein
MAAQCPNCGTFRTRVSGCRGCLLDLFHSAGVVLLGLGGLLLPIGCIFTSLAARANPLLAGQQLLPALLLIGAGLLPLALARIGAGHAWFCHLCGCRWRG